MPFVVTVMFANYVRVAPPGSDTNAFRTSDWEMRLGKRLKIRLDTNGQLAAAGETAMGAYWAQCRR
jgi:hypothetical protein